MRLTVQFDLHSRWCLEDEVGVVPLAVMGRSGRRVGSTEACSKSVACLISDAGCVHLVGADVECERAKDGCCREGDVFGSKIFEMDRVTASIRGGNAH